MVKLNIYIFILTLLRNILLFYNFKSVKIFKFVKIIGKILTQKQAHFISGGD